MKHAEPVVYLTDGNPKTRDEEPKTKAKKPEGPLAEARQRWLRGNYEEARAQFEKLLTEEKQGPAAARQLVDAGRLLVFIKGTDSHDYKFSSAVLEDYTHISPAWRDRFLAASVFWLIGSAGPDAPVVKRTRAALA